MLLYFFLLGKIFSTLISILFHSGLIEKVTGLSLHVDFMVKHKKKNNLFLWPPKPDKQLVKERDVLMVLSQAPVAADRNHFVVPQAEVINRLV